MRCPAFAVSLFGAFALSIGLMGCDKNASSEATTNARADARTAAAPASGPASGPGAAPSAPAPSTDAKVFFVWPQSGSTVFSQFPAVFGATGMTVTKAGESPDDKSRGHHHVLIDKEPIPAGTVIPMDDDHIHFGMAQTEAMLTVAAGARRLTLQFGDGAHRSLGPEMSSTIDLKVVAAPKEMGVHFVEPKDGATVTSPVKMKFGVKGFGLQPAGEDLFDKTKGHHHVIIDGVPLAAGAMVPMDEKNIHYGKAQTEAELALPKGKHTLTLQFADGGHLSYGPTMSTTITVTVK